MSKVGMSISETVIITLVVQVFTPFVAYISNNKLEYGYRLPGTNDWTGKFGVKVKVAPLWYKHGKFVLNYLQ